MNWSDTTFWTPDGYCLCELLLSAAWASDVNSWNKWNLIRFILKITRWHFYFPFKIYTFHRILARNKECIFKEHCGILCSLQNTLIQVLVHKNGLHIISAILMLKLDSQGLSVKFSWVKHSINFTYFKLYWIMTIFIFYIPFPEIMNK